MKYQRVKLFQFKDFTLDEQTVFWRWRDWIGCPENTTLTYWSVEAHRKISSKPFDNPMKYACIIDQALIRLGAVDGEQIILDTRK